MKRQDFINKMHENLYQENLSGLFSKDTMLQFEITKDLASDVLLIQKELSLTFKKALKDILEYNFSQMEIIDYVSENISLGYNNEMQVAINYNTLYDDFVEKGVVKNNDTFVYRLENDNGVGIYNATSKDNKKIHNNFDFGRSSPSPLEDSCLKSIFGSRKNYGEELQREWFFGFSSLDKLYNWFDSEDGLINFVVEDLNAHIVKYKINESDTLSSELQTAFRKEKASDTKIIKMPYQLEEAKKAFDMAEKTPEIKPEKASRARRRKI